MYKIRKFIHSILRKEEMELLIEARKRLIISKEDLSILREKEFLKLYNHAINNSQYYGKILKNLSINDISDIKKIPILTKEILKREHSNILCESDKKYFKSNSTSGSTGEATLFGVDYRSITSTDMILNRANEINGRYKYLDKIVIFWGAERDILSKRNLKRYYNYFIKGRKTISTYYMTEKDIKENIQFLNRFRPKLIVGYPSALNFIADFLASNPNILKYKPDVVISAGEMLYEIQRENIEKYFGASVFNRYGCREVGNIAAECSAYEGLHYDADRLIIEIVDDDGNICPPNVVGNILITDLTNHVFPLIRYKIGDIGSMSVETECTCGCTLPKINKIEGRSFDVIKGVNGNSVSGSFWTLTFRFQVKGIENFQVRQKLIDKLELRIKVNNEFNDNQKDRIIMLVKKKLGEQMQIKITKVDDFEYSPTGKFKWIVSDLNSN